MNRSLVLGALLTFAACTGTAELEKPGGSAAVGGSADVAADAGSGTNSGGGAIALGSDGSGVTGGTGVMPGGPVVPIGGGGGGETGTGGGAAGGGVATGGGAGGGAAPAGLDLDHPLTPGDPGAVTVTLAIRSDQSRHAISPLVYGTNQAVDTATNRYGVIRKGGNRLTAYNWENNASNAGSDYLYENDDHLSSSTTPGDALRGTIDGARSVGGAALLTIPIVDYVAADTNASGGDVRNSGASYLTTRFKQNRATSTAAPTATPNTSDAFVNQDDFVTWVQANTAGVPVIFSLDNEPDLWSDTHPEVHPVPVTYAELLSRTITFATMAKRLAPAVPIAGFVSYGWVGYVNLQNATDAAGQPEFVDDFLAQMKIAEGTAGHRLIDYLDLHWYPEATGGGSRITGTNVSAAVVEARVQAPRSLWDPTYQETSWIQRSLGAPIGLIPRMKAKIAANYPGTQLAFTEWNYGGGDDISGAVATADVLGIFGREGVGLSTLWKLNGAEVFNDAAIRAFRNFDGASGTFGDTSIAASTSDVAVATVYASVDAANPARTVIVAINKSASVTTAGITVAHPSAYGHLSAYVLTAAGGARLVHAADVAATGANAFRYDMPPMSVSVLVPGS